MRLRYVALALICLPGAASAANWTLELSGGLAALPDEGSQPFMAATLSRDLGAWQLRGGLAWYGGSDDEEARPTALLPAATWQATAGVGYVTGPVLIDVYASVGRRRFDPVVRDIQNGRTIRFEAEGGLFTLGGSLTLDAPIRPGWTAAPFVSVSYSVLDTARTVIPPAGAPLIEERTEKGATGTVGVSVDRAWAGGSLGVYLAAAGTTNRASVDRQGNPNLSTGVTRLPADENGGDAWLEYGLTGSVALSPNVALDAAVVRTAGFADGETTSVTAGFRIAF
jgi:hypothetical protein